MRDVCCLGKQAFGSWREADRVLRLRRRRSKDKAHAYPLEAYRCPACGLWHHGGRKR